MSIPNCIKCSGFIPLNSNLNGSTTILNKNYLNVNAAVKAGVKYLRCSTVPNAAMNAGTSYSVGTLPENMRPTYKISQEILCGGGNIIRLDITTDGAFTVVPSQAIPITTGININFAFI